MNLCLVAPNTSAATILHYLTKHDVSKAYLMHQCSNLRLAERPVLIHPHALDRMPPGLRLDAVTSTQPPTF